MFLDAAAIVAMLSDARHYRVPILSTADEFRFTDIETVP
jgi:uncharacterized protein with PIN domain